MIRKIPKHIMDKFREIEILTEKIETLAEEIDEELLKNFKGKFTIDPEPSYMYNIYELGKFFDDSPCIFAQYTDDSHMGYMYNNSDLSGGASDDFDELENQVFFDTFEEAENYLKENNLNYSKKLRK